MRRNEKLTPEHTARRAIVYVRQSTQGQVLGNLESQRLQYALVERAHEYGFDNIEVYDQDLGRSATGTTERPGFDRLVGDVLRGEVGGVFCLEASRLARNGRDWHHLIELCALTKTVIVDSDAIYDPQRTNDRLLLGVKGTMSEFEVSLLRQRSQEARAAKAARGELSFRLPVGLCWDSLGGLETEPNQRVRDAIARIFRRFDELGSARQVFIWMRDQDLQMPVKGARSEVVWQQPTYARVIAVLKNPLYAGVYAYGRRESDVEVIDGRARKKTVQRNTAPEEWDVLLHDWFEGYITWAQYERNQMTLSQNSYMKSKTERRAGRGGKALLTGLMRCARCGRIVGVDYNKIVRYRCRSDRTNYGTTSCIGFGAQQVERGVSDAILRVIEPQAIDEAIEMATQGTTQALERVRAVELELEEASHRAELARRRFEAVDPDNRLVAAELEGRWNAALEHVLNVESKLENAQAAARKSSVPSRANLRALADQLPTVWHNPATDMAIKQRIARVLINEIIVDVDEERCELSLAIHWVGGRHTELRVPKRGRPKSYTNLEAIEVIRKMAGRYADEQIARTLNRLGMRTGKDNGWTARRVSSARYSRGIPNENPKDRSEYLTMSQAADKLNVSRTSIASMIRRGQLPAVHVMPGAPWEIDPADLEKPEVREAVARLRENRPCTANDENQLSLKTTT